MGRNKETKTKNRTMANNLRKIARQLLCYLSHYIAMSVRSTVTYNIHNI